MARIAPDPQPDDHRYHRRLGRTLPDHTGTFSGRWQTAAGVQTASAAIAHPPAFPVQQPEQRCLAHAQRSSQGRGGAARSRGPVPRAARGCAQTRARDRRARNLAPVPGSGENPSRRPAAGEMEREQYSAFRVDAGTDPATAFGKCHLSRHRAAVRRRHDQDRDVGRRRGAEYHDQQSVAGRAQGDTQQGQQARAGKHPPAPGDPIRQRCQHAGHSGRRPVSCQDQNADHPGMTMELAAKSRLFLDRLRGRARDIEKSLERLLPAAETLPDEKTEFLPNFCTGEVVFNVVVVAEMLAIVINLIIPRNFLSPTVLQDLLLISLFIQWVALAGTVVLCYTRKYLNRLPNLRALGMAYLLLLLTTFVVSEITVLILWAVGRVDGPRPAWYVDFNILTLTISAMINGLLLRLFLAKHELTQRTLSEARAKLQALQTRIRPHFVFNSMNIIASLTRNAPNKAE